MTHSTPDYFLNSKKVLLSIGAAFFVTNCIELLLICLVNVLLKKNSDATIAVYFIRSIVIVSGLWVSFRMFKNAPIYILALSTSAISTCTLSISLLFASFEWVEFALTNFISTFVLIFVWMHLTQNLENKSRALKIGYFSYFISIECVSLIPSSIRGENHVVFLLFALLGYKISSVLFELAVKTAFKISHASIT